MLRIAQCPCTGGLLLDKVAQNVDETLRCLQRTYPLQISALYLLEEEEEKKTFILITCYISSAYIFKYMKQLVVEGKIRTQNMSVYDIPL